MSEGTRQANINSRVKRIVNLNDDDVTELNTIGIANEADLSVVNFGDLPNAVNLIKRRKLEVCSKFLRFDSNQLTNTMTFREVQTRLSQREHPAPQAQVYAQPARAVDPTRGAPRVYTDPLPEFSGDPVDYEEWERKAGATIRQTVYRNFITRAAIQGDTIEEARSAELFNMILSCVGDGHALNTVEKVRDDNGECGHSAWKALENWYLDGSQKAQLIAHYEAKLNDLYLDTDKTATEFINSFELNVRKLNKAEGIEWDDIKKIRAFKERVTDLDYDTEIRTHTGTFNELLCRFVSGKGIWRRKL